MKKRFLSILVVLLLLVSNSVPAFCNEVSTDDEAIMNGEDVEYDTSVNEIINNEDEITYPSQNFYNKTESGIIVEASVKEDVFPQGTEMRISSVSSDIEEKIKEVTNGLINDDQEVVDVKAVDISFFYNDEIICPKDGKNVYVKMHSENIVEGENQIVVHFIYNEDEKIATAEVVKAEEDIKEETLNDSESFNIDEETFCFYIGESSTYAIVGTDFISTTSSTDDTIVDNYEVYEETYVEVLWDDEDNKDDIRPEAVTINLLANEKKIDRVMVTKYDGWEYCFKNLLKYEEGEEIVYTIEEETIEGYNTQIDGFNIINTHKPETTKVEGKMTWDDEDNKDGIRPEAVTINLMANDKEIDTATISEYDGWQYSFEDLSKYEEGEKIVYTIEEETIEGYSTKIDGFNIINTHKPETTKVAGKIEWNDEKNNDDIRPETVTINLLANGEKTDSVVVSDRKEWSFVFENLPKYREGKKITYSIEEEDIKGYKTKINGFNIMNTHNPETIVVEGEIMWKDENNINRVRPESVTIILFANGKETESVVVSDRKDWKYSFEYLLKFEEGKKIDYTIKPETVEGYSTIIDGFDIINKYKPNEKNEPEKDSNQNKSAKTGDNNNILILIVIIIMSIFSIVGLIYFKKKNN